MHCMWLAVKLLTNLTDVFIVLAMNISVTRLDRFCEVLMFDWIGLLERVRKFR